eukprot:453126_1
MSMFLLVPLQKISVSPTYRNYFRRKHRTKYYYLVTFYITCLLTIMFIVENFIFVATFYYNVLTSQQGMNDILVVTAFSLSFAPTGFFVWLYGKYCAVLYPLDNSNHPPDIIDTNSVPLKSSAFGTSTNTYGNSAMTHVHSYMGLETVTEDKEINYTHKKDEYINISNLLNSGKYMKSPIESPSQKHQEQKYESPLPILVESQKRSQSESNILPKRSYQHMEKSHSINECNSIKRIEKCLALCNDSAITFHKLYRDRITDILNDYHHIIHDHRDEYDDIYPKMRFCDATSCTILNAISCDGHTEIIYSIHMYMMHSYDLGYRRQLRLTNRTLNNTKIRKDFDRYKTNNDSFEIKDNLDDTVENTGRYAFGVRYFYWDKYKGNMMYVQKDKQTLKEEIVENYLDKDEYDSIYQRGTYLITTNIAKKIVAFKSKYDIIKDEPMHMSNIMVVYMYCQFDELCTDFSKTFRPILKNESLNSMKNRNAKYWWMSKILRETVEYYGSKMKDSKITKYYHGTSNLTFDLFVVKAKGPVSTTISIDAAKQFTKRIADQGILVEFAPYSPNLTAFNCSWFSPYPAEEERLFFGGNGLLQIQNLTLLTDEGKEEEFKKYIKSIRRFHCFVRGSELNIVYDENDQDIDDVKEHLTSTYNNITTETDKLIILALMDQYLNNKNNGYPQYVNRIFQKFCQRRAAVFIDTETLHSIYEPFTNIFGLENKNLIKLDKIVELFPQCRNVTINNITEFIGQPFMNDVKKIVNRINTHEKSQMKCITLSKVRLIQSSVSFKQSGWKTEIKSPNTLFVNNTLTDLKILRIDA